MSVPLCDNQQIAFAQEVADLLEARVRDLVAAAVRDHQAHAVAREAARLRWLVCLQLWRQREVQRIQGASVGTRLAILDNRIDLVAYDSHGLMSWGVVAPLL